MEIGKIGVLGSGIMGSGIAQVAAMSGYEVIVRDVLEECLEFARANVSKSLDKLVKKGRIEADGASRILEAIEWTTKLEALGSTELLLEAVPEDTQTKSSMYQALQPILDEKTIIASNTSTISISLLQSYVSNPTRFVGMHWFNPPLLMKLIEIIKGVQTSDETVNEVVNVCKSMQKETIVCLDSQGFVTSRALLAFRAECYRIYEEGIATKEDIDKACRLAFGHPMGQFELADFSGLDIEVNAYKGLAEIYGDRFRPSQRLLNLVRAGRFGRKSKHGWYDYED